MGSDQLVFSRCTGCPGKRLVCPPRLGISFWAKTSILSSNTYVSVHFKCHLHKRHKHREVESQIRSRKLVQRYSSSEMQREARHLWINTCVRKLASTFDNHTNYLYVSMLSDAFRRFAFCTSWGWSTDDDNQVCLLPILACQISGAFNCSLCFSQLNCRVGWPSIEKWRTEFSSNLELWDEIESYKRWSTSLCRAQNKATQWLNLVDFFAIAPYYVSLRCLAQQVFSWYASHSCYPDVC